jgi:hypothetical protein
VILFKADPYLSPSHVREFKSCFVGLLFGAWVHLD